MPMGWNDSASTHFFIFMSMGRNDFGIPLGLLYAYEVERPDFGTLFNFFYAYRVESKESTISSGVWDEIQLPKSGKK